MAAENPNKEEILADFQSCTGLDDIGECIMYLEAAKWNLLDAINHVMPQETQTLPSEQQEIREDASPPSDIKILHSTFASDNAHSLQRDGGTSTAGQDIQADGPSSAMPEGGIVQLVVNYNGRSIPLEIPDSETVATIKTALYSELGVAPCKQRLVGWRNNHHITDETRLSQLHLPAGTTLHLLTPDASGSDVTPMDTSSSEASPRFELHISDLTNNKTYRLPFPASKTILDIKQDVYSVTNIPVRFQKWTGWPDGANDYRTLGSMRGVSSGHCLTVQRVESSPGKQVVVDLASSDSSAEEFEDANEAVVVDVEEYFQGDDTAATRKMQPLMPDGVEDETAAVSHFSSEFAHRFGDLHPMFFQGTLSEALQASCARPAKERRPLAVYLHHDGSILANVFCSQRLCTESIVAYLGANFVTWAWDLTFDANKSRFLAMVSQYLGMAAASAIRHISVDNLPALMVITKLRGVTEVFSVIPGSVTLDELMTRLIQAVDVFSSQLAAEIDEEREREARELMKREQDAAYEASLMADRAKEEAKRLEQEERQRREIEEQRERQREEERRQHQEAIKMAIRESLAQQLPSEPPEGGPDPTSQIRVRLPSGEVLSRRFLANSSLQVVLDFLASKGYPSEEYKFLASWPRRDLSSLDPKKSLEEVNLYPQETITIEAR